MPSDGACRGLISIWDDKLLCGEGVVKTQRILATKLRSMQDHFGWVMANVYGPNAEGERDLFWDSLSSVLAQCISSVASSCVHWGDLNIIKYPHEKKRGRYISSSMARFSEFINEHELVDLPLVGRKITWSNNQERAAVSRIDRFLLSKEWGDHFTRVIQLGLPRGLSDHCPLKLSPSTVDWGPKSFRFENCWLSHKEFIPMARNCWLQSKVQGFAGFRISKKFQEHKGKVKNLGSRGF